MKHVWNQIVIGLSLLSAPAAASEPDSAAGTPSLRLDASSVRIRASTRGPTVRSAQAGSTAAARASGAIGAWLPYPPRFEAEVARHSYPGGAGVDVTASLWRDFSLGGYGSARRSYAQSVKVMRGVELELARRNAIAHALLFWVQARYGRDLLALREKSAAVAEQMLTIARARVRGGTSPPLEVALATSVLGQARASVLDAEGIVVDADASLNHSIGLPPTAHAEPSLILAKSDDRPIDPNLTIDRALRSHPLVRLARVRIREAETLADMTSASHRPVLGLGVSYGHEATGDRILGGKVSVPLPLVDPGAFETAVARGTAMVEQARMSETQAQILRDVRLAIHEREHAREMRETLRTLAIEPGRRALDEIVRRYQSGDTALTEMLAARRELLAAEEAFLAACADVHRSDIRLEQAVGGPVPRKDAP